MRLSPLRISAIYLVLGTLWITLSDKILFLYYDGSNHTLFHSISISKGLTFIVITSLLLWQLIKLNNKRLQDSEKQYRQIFEGNNLPMWIYNPVTLKFVSVNNMAITHYGYTREQFLNMSILDIRPPDDAEKVKKSIKNVSDLIKRSGTWSHYKADGTPIYVSISSQKILFNQQEHIMVTAQDVTEKVYFEQRLKLLNEDLNEQKRKLSETQQIAKIGGWEYYLKSQHLEWSDEMYIITEMEPDPQLNLYDLYVKQIHPEDRPLMLEALDLLMTTGKPFDIIHRVKLLNGKVLFVRQLARLGYNPDGQPHKLIGSMQDVSELKQLETELNRYLFSLEDTLNSINEGFYTLNKDLIFTKVNKKFELETGLSGNQVIGQHLAAVFPGMEGRTTYKQYEKVMRDRVPVKFEAYWRHFKKWHSVSAYPTEDGIAVYFNDITEKIEKDIKLKEAIELYEIVSKATQDVIYDCDVTTLEIKFNANVTSLLGVRSEDAGNDVAWWMSLIHPDDAERVMDTQHQVIAKKGTNWSCQYRVLCNDGRYKYIFSQGYYIYDEHLAPVRMIGAMRDVDELIRSNEENKRLADIITKINNMVIVMDLDNCITWVNKAFEDYSGYKLEEIKGHWPSKFLGGEKLSPEMIESIICRKANQEKFAIDLKHHLKDGRTQWVNVEYTPMFDDKGVHTGYIAVHKNITERKEREEKIYKQNKILQDISWLSSHEIRRPVASILGLSYLAKDAELIEEKDEIIEMINYCATELDEIVHDITDKISNELYFGNDNIALEKLK